MKWLGQRERQKLKEEEKLHKKRHNKKPKKKKKVYAKKEFTSYKEYIVSNTWRNKRKRILKRAKGICERCKVVKAKQVHHKHYKTLYNERDKDLIALCGICHGTIHNKISDEQIEIIVDKIMLQDISLKNWSV